MEMAAGQVATIEAFDHFEQVHGKDG